MSKVYKSSADPRSRSDSFVRMLELEKMYQMQRLQHEHDSSTSTSNPSRSSFPSVVADPPAPRTRRTNDHPPLSNQPQIMKANRRSAGLPPLSVSIPPSPTHALAVRPGASVEDVSLAKEEHVKTVTFSEPEEEDLSDNSSICQSPSWDKWDKKKPKKSKKGDRQKNAKEADDKAHKKKSNRLVKTAPTNTSAPKPLTTSDRSTSAPDLGSSAPNDRMDLTALAAGIRAATGASLTSSIESTAGTKGGRPKSRGFLSGFRSDSENGRGFMGTRKSAKKGADDSGASRNVTDSEAAPSRPPNASRSGSENNMQKSKKLPSAEAATSSSDRPQMPQEKRGSGTRPPSSSGHGRSQSLLSSTLNRLRGGSYFSSHASGDSSANKSSKQSSSSQGTTTGQDKPSEKPTERVDKAPEETNQPDHEGPKHSFDFAFSSSKSQEVNMEPGPDIAPRGRQPRSRKVEIPSPSPEPDVMDSRYPDNRRVQGNTSTMPARDLLVAAQERQHQAAKLNNTSGSQMLNGQFANSSTAFMHSENNSEPRIPPMASARLEVRLETTAQTSAEDVSSFERDVPDRMQQPMQTQRDVDFFEYFSEAYVPPVLDLRSPNEQTRARSPKFPFPEESDEDVGTGNSRDQFMNGQAMQASTTNEGVRMGAHAMSPPPRDIGRVMKDQRRNDSPAISVQCSDNDVPSFERLGLPSKSAKTLGGTETTGSSTAPSQKTDPSRATSERSSSSTCDDLPPSPSSITTPESSRPQSRKGLAASNSEAPQGSLLGTGSQAANRKTRRTFRGVSSDRSNMTVNGARRQTNVVPGLEQQSAPTMGTNGGLTVTLSPGDTPTSATFAEAPTPDSDEANEQDIDQYLAPSSSQKAQSAVDLNSATKLLPRSLRSQRLQLKAGAVGSSVSLPSSSPLDFTEDVVPRKSALKTSRANTVVNETEPSTAISMGAAYLQEARKAAPVATASTSRALRPPYMHKSLSGSMKSVVSSGSGGRPEPIAKILVECCNCHFLHDMPSRVYECMAKPDTVVEDKSLGVSAAITRMVKCPWCSHGMTTQCCPGYTAVVYLQEKLHGK